MKKKLLDLLYQEHSVLPWCCSVFKDKLLLLEFCIQTWGSQHKKGMGLLEQIQRRATEMIRGLECLSCVGRLWELDLFSLEEALGRLHYSLPVLANNFLHDLTVIGQGKTALN